MNHKLFILLTVIFFILIPKQKVVANGGIGIAYDVQIKDSGVKDGHLISFSKGEYHLAIPGTESQIVGVVIKQPSIVLKKPLVKNTFPIISAGDVSVITNNQNGEIKIGDSLTLSDQPGEAMKNDGGHDSIGEVLGVLDQNRAIIRLNTNKKTLSSPQNYNVEGKPSGIFDTLKRAFTLSNVAAQDDPSAAFKNIIAAVVIMFSILFTFFTVGRTARKGIEAFGRNPLAAKLISLGLVFNVAIAVAILGVGLVVAVFILRM